MNALNCKQFREMLVSGANNLANQHEYINTLNVFPVPDGDTGTNMNMTFGSGVREAVKLPSENIGEVSKALGKNMLMSARGNSGVILSQIFKGIYRSLTDKQTATAQDFCEAFENASRIAYKAVMKPVEGTILTVIRESSEDASRFFKANKKCTVEQYFQALEEAARKSLEHTPELLPVLKEVGVVDSGGAGLVTIIEGFNAYLHGKPIALAGAQETKAVEKGYCVEIALKVTNKDHDYDNFRNLLGHSGSIENVAREDDVIRLHVHTLKPGDVLNRCQKEGILETIKMENLEVDHHVTLDYTEKEIENVPYAIISVVNGKGIEEMFRQAGVEYFVSGGQTMNPAAGDFVSVIRNIHADTVFILPNNSNIILKEAIRNVKTGSVTTAIKDTSFNKVTIHKDDYMGIFEKDIVVSSPDMMEAARKLIDAMIDEDASYVTLIYGLGADEGQAHEIEKYITDKYQLDCGVSSGGQDIYPFIIGVE